MYLRGPPNIVLCVGKKIVTVRRINQIICQEKRKKLRFWKMKLKVKLEYSDKTSCFELELFVQAALENFLWGLRQRWRYLGGPLDLVLCVGKKIVTIRHTYSIICQEKRKKLWFWKMKLKVSLEYSDKTSCFELKLFQNEPKKLSLGDATVKQKNWSLHMYQ